MFKKVVDKFYVLLGYRRSNKLKRFLNSNKKENKQILKCNAKFYNLHKGKRCFIIGNGPSAKNINFQDLKNEYTFTVNQFARFENYKDLNSNYHVFSDERLFALDENNPDDREALTYLAKIADLRPKVQFFSKLCSKNFFENASIFKDIDINYYIDGLVFHDGYELDCDITKQIPWFPTCIDYCIFIAMYMGFTEIYLLGCECTGFLRATMFDKNINDNISYGYNVSDNEKRRIERQFKMCGIADELEIGAKVLKYYDYLAKMAKRDGVRIVNCTDGGILESFERMSLDDVLKKS